MGEACGDQQGAGIVLRKDFAMPFEIGRRSGAQIDGDVEDDALEAGHEFGLIMRSALEMHTADDTFFPRHRVIDLCDAAGTKPGYFFDAEKAGKEAAVIAETLAFDEREVGERGRREGETLHGSSREIHTPRRCPRRDGKASGLELLT